MPTTIETLIEKIDNDIYPQYELIVKDFNSIPGPKPEYCGRIEAWDVRQVTHILSKPHPGEYDRLLHAAGSMSSFIQYADEWIVEYLRYNEPPQRRIQQMRDSKKLLEDVYTLLWAEIENRRC